METDAQSFYRRAQSELSLARAADTPELVRAHHTLAAYYLEQVNRCDPRDPPVEPNPLRIEI